ncbi:glycosyltransferase family 2 protein, partial [candidate division CSSED10-310 bacterium]
MFPRISIIIPAYNVGQYIGKCLSSLYRQNEKNFEIIVVDDGSNDDTLQQLRQFQNPKLQLIRNKDNRGPSYARNRALSLATGEWVAFVDADDWCDQERFKRFLMIADEKQVDMIADDVHISSDEYIESKETALSRRGIKLVDPILVNPVKFVEWDLGIMKPM